MTVNAVDKHGGLALVLYLDAVVATYLELDVVTEDSGIEVGQSGPVGLSQYLDQGLNPSSLACAGEGQSNRLWCQFLGCRWLLGCLSAPTRRIPGLPVWAASYSTGLSLDLTGFPGPSPGAATNVICSRLEVICLSPSQLVFK